MPTLLYRYILGDLLRVLLLTTAVLVTIIAFGATIKPLTNDGLLGVGETVKYLLHSIVPMLEVGQPVSAGCASTMVLQRMTRDNEILAAAASGMSYRRLLLPIAGLGIALVVVMVLLTQWAIPRFWEQMERTIASDVTRMFEASIDSGRPFQLGNMQIYADNMWVVANPSDTQADTRLILSRVVAAEMDEHGRVETDVTANQAVVDIHRRDGDTYLQLVLSDAVAFDGQPGQLARLPQLEPSSAILVPNVLSSETRAMTRGQLLELRDNPDLYGRVNEQKVELAQAIRNAELWTTASEHLRSTGRMRLVQSGPTQRSYVVEADDIVEGTFFTDDDQPLEVRQYEGDRLIRRITAEHAALHRLSAATIDTLAFELQLLRASVTDLRDDEPAVNQRERLVDHNLVPADFEIADLAELPSHALLARAASMEQPTGSVQDEASLLQYRLVNLENEIIGRLHNRYAQSLTVLLLLLMGASLAMWLRNALPLVIYIWAFAPSVLALILASGGEKMMRDGDFVGGFAVMWGGNAAMLFVLCFAYWNLRKN